MSLNKILFKKVIDEFKANKRTLIINGTNKEESFQLFPVSNKILNSEEDIFGINDTSRISRTVTIEEAIKLKDNPKCDNKEVINHFLKSIKAI